MNIKENLNVGMRKVESKIVDALSMNMDLKRFTKTSRILSPVLAVGMALAALSDSKPAQAQQAGKILLEFDQCGQTEGLMDYAANVDVLVRKVEFPDGRIDWIHDIFSVDEDCPIKPASAPVEQQASFEVCPPVTAIAVPGRHSEIQAANLDASFPQFRWVNPIYDARTANAANNWRGIGPWAPVAFGNVDANAAVLTTFGNLGHFVVQSVNGGRVALAFMQEAQHQNETKLRPDGKVDNNWKNQYTFKGLKPNTSFSIFNPDTGEILNKWPDGTPINYTANGIGTFSMELDPGEVRVGVCFTMPGNVTGEQAIQVDVYRGPNDHPELRGENPLPMAVNKAVIAD